MKNYMNREERNDYIMAISFAGQLKRMADEWQDRGALTNQEAGALRQSATRSVNALADIAARMDEKFVSVLLRDVDAVDIFCLPKDKARLVKDRYEKEHSEELCEVRLEALETLAEKAFYWCCSCTEEDKAACILRSVFTELAVPPYSDDQECPFEILK